MAPLIQVNLQMSEKPVIKKREQNNETNAQK